MITVSPAARPARCRGGGFAWQVQVIARCDGRSTQERVRRHVGLGGAGGPADDTAARPLAGESGRQASGGTET
ncbi:hypothetical protein BL253_26605 [Pseudofrankia asymbiotica]|uniref:Uncharacterized protein n=1 Tax=Pseudofrankia asymbiotica TaxID=1834516 RepID=A0A1V2I4H0_9ACTN|nr:hypothetical protein BL253_26605 [Pseudofrankia asymbiotica]